MANGAWAVQLNLKKAFEDREAEARNITIKAAKAALVKIRDRQLAAPQGDTDPDKNVQNSKDRIEKAIAWANAQAPSEKTTEGDTWINRSYRAARGILPVIIEGKGEIGFGIKHTMFYGAYLELGHNRRYAIIEPMIRSLAPYYIEAIRRIYRG